MENKSGQLLILFFTLLHLSSSCCIYFTSAKKPTHLFPHFTLNKSEETKIDRSLFNPQDVDVEEIFHSQEAAGLKANDMIKSLPGQPLVTFKQYGGYVNVDKNSGRELFYYFVEAKVSPETAPLLLWLNGGPGCSSLGYGAMEELGPFRVHSDGKTLYENEFAWNSVANVLFLESPAGVGFSYSNNKTDYVEVGDIRTARDSYIFLLNWLERFPEYKGRDFYVSGESYAGHYVPQLAQTILHNMNQKAKKTIINLKGIIIGNAVINDETDIRGMYEYFGSHALISDDTANQIAKDCDFSPNVNLSNACTAALNESDKVFEEIDVYNIYAPLCFDTNLTDKPNKASIMSPDPCSYIYVYAYLNRLDVQNALHANVARNITWQHCSSVITNWTDSPSTIIPLLKEILKNGLRVWIFSGDIDGRVPVTSTQLSIKEMRIPIETQWYPWFLSGEVGGYTTVYDHGLTFATIRGAGHEVPFYKPDTALFLIKHFLAGKKLPKS